MHFICFSINTYAGRLRYNQTIYAGSEQQIRQRQDESEVFNFLFIFCDGFGAIKHETAAFSRKTCTQYKSQ